MKIVCFFFLNKKVLLITLFFNSFLVLQEPILGHGNKDNCMSECKSYYCPSDFKEKGNKTGNDSYRKSNKNLTED